jgi:hypothetical protein
VVGPGVVGPEVVVVIGGGVVPSDLSSNCMTILSKTMNPVEVSAVI